MPFGIGFQVLSYTYICHYGYEGYGHYPKYTRYAIRRRQYTEEEFYRHTMIVSYAMSEILYIHLRHAAYYGHYIEHCYFVGAGYLLPSFTIFICRHTIVVTFVRCRLYAYRYRHHCRQFAILHCHTPTLFTNMFISRHILPLLPYLIYITPVWFISAAATRFTPLLLSWRHFYHIYLRPGLLRAYEGHILRCSRYTVVVVTLGHAARYYRHALLLFCHIRAYHAPASFRIYAKAFIILLFAVIYYATFTYIIIITFIIYDAEHTAISFFAPLFCH